MELLHVQGRKRNIKALGDYLHADRSPKGKDDNFDLVPISRERYGAQLSVEIVFI
jgi:hypothetical protein